jgi:hypothetical protein
MYSGKIIIKSSKNETLSVPYLGRFSPRKGMGMR